MYGGVFEGDAALRAALLSDGLSVTRFMPNATTAAIAMTAKRPMSKPAPRREALSVFAMPNLLRSKGQLMPAIHSGS